MPLCSIDGSFVVPVVCCRSYGLICAFSLRFITMHAFLCCNLMVLWRIQFVDFGSTCFLFLSSYVFHSPVYDGLFAYWWDYLCPLMCNALTNCYYWSQLQKLQSYSCSIESHPEFLDEILDVVNKDQVYRRLFVRGVGYETSEESVRQVFSAFGDLEECSLIMDRATGRTKGYGFVSKINLFLIFMDPISPFGW